MRRLSSARARGYPLRPGTAPNPVSNEAKRLSCDRRAFLATGALAFGTACATNSGAGRAPTSAAILDADAERQDLFAHVADQSASVAPITSAERRERRARLSRALSSAGADALICEPGPTLTHLAGIAWGKSERLFALIVLADGSHFWLVPSFEEARARALIDADDGPRGALVTWREDEHAIAPLAAELRTRRVERLLVEPQIRYVFAERLSRALAPARVESGENAIVELRGTKDLHELAILRRANELTQSAIREVARTLAPGVTSAEIGARMDLVHTRLGMRSPWNLSLIGPAAALPHGNGAGVPLARGDVLLIDTGAALHGYQSDITRTWTFDAEPDAEVARVWHSVRDAQQAAFDAIEPGVIARTIDARARELLTARGFGSGYSAFTHRLGHGIGLEGHEDPYFDGGNETVLARGMTLSVEPGLYFPGRFGVRIEDIVAVTHDGAERFGTWQRGPGSPE